MSIGNNAWDDYFAKLGLDVAKLKQGKDIKLKIGDASVSVPFSWYNVTMQYISTHPGPFSPDQMVSQLFFKPNRIEYASKENAAFYRENPNKTETVQIEKLFGFKEMQKPLRELLLLESEGVEHLGDAEYNAWLSTGKRAIFYGNKTLIGSMSIMSYWKSIDLKSAMDAFGRSNGFNVQYTEFQWGKKHTCVTKSLDSVLVRGELLDASGKTAPANLTGDEANIAIVAAYSLSPASPTEPYSRPLSTLLLSDKPNDGPAPKVVQAIKNLKPIPVEDWIAMVQYAATNNLALSMAPNTTNPNFLFEAPKIKF